MNNQYYMLYLDEPAEPSFCSFAKQYFGTIEDIGLVMCELEKTMQYKSTVIEQQCDDIQSIDDEMNNPEKLIFDKICDEIFADG